MGRWTWNRQKDSQLTSQKTETDTERIGRLPAGQKDRQVVIVCTQMVNWLSQVLKVHLTECQCKKGGPGCHHQIKRDRDLEMEAETTTRKDGETKTDRTGRHLQPGSHFIDWPLASDRQIDCRWVTRWMNRWIGGQAVVQTTGDFWCDQGLEHLCQPALCHWVLFVVSG